MNEYSRINWDKYASLHKVDWGPGYQLFLCEDCGHEWHERSRHCESPSLSSCPLCHEEVHPYAFERHYEWPTDRSGNLLAEGE